MPKTNKDYDYKLLVINFKNQHKSLYDWLKKYCNKKGISISHQVREILEQFKEAETKK